tara:strand:- start:21540 stop:21941 length:402 start_codon:yes stop_codon:yes gene_type:complete
MSKTIKRTDIVEIDGEKVELQAIPVPRIISILARNKQLAGAIGDAVDGDFTSFEIFEDMTEDLMNELIDASAGWNSGKAQSMEIESTDQALAALTAIELTIPEGEKKILAFKKVFKALMAKMHMMNAMAGVSS